VPHTDNAALASVQTVWEVEADETYHGLHETGLSADGLFVSIQGNGIVRLGAGDNQSVYALGSPQFMFVPHGVPCSYWSSGSVNWRFFYLEFESNEYFEALGMTYSTPYDLRALPSIPSMCRRIVRELAESDRRSDVAAAGEFTRLLVRLARAQEVLRPRPSLVDAKATAVTDDSAIRNVLSWMEKHLEERHSVIDFAEIAGLSRRQLYRRFLAVTGISPKQYFLTLKLQAASRRLQNSQDSVAEIAERYGFADGYHLSRTFSRYMGCSPTAFRRVVYAQCVSDRAYSTPCIARNRVGETPSVRRNTAPK
jgi:AraC-like DNA-binding protein